MTFGFLVGSRNFIRLFCVSWDFFVLHGYDCHHWVAKSCTTTAYGWLFRSSPSSVRTLWSAVIKSPNISALGTIVPVRFLQDALVILVLRQISQFRSFGKWGKMLCLPDTTFARGSGDNSWEELEASRCSGTHSSTRPCLNSCSYSVRSCDKFHRTSSLSSFLLEFSASAGPRDKFPCTSPRILSLLVDAGCSMGAAVSCDEDVGEVGEEWAWRACR